MKWTTAAVVAVLLVLPSAASIAHHGWSGYDQSTTLNLTGTIKDSGYEHPHGHVRLQTPEKTWLVTLAPPSRMERRGLPATAFTAGAEATVVGYPSRTDPNEMRAERIMIAGQMVELR
jgi:hypothetical protein